jgi:hypothetical protein
LSKGGDPSKRAKNKKYSWKLDEGIGILKIKEIILKQGSNFFEVLYRLYFDYIPKGLSADKIALRFKTL